MVDQHEPSGRHPGALLSEGEVRLVDLPVAESLATGIGATGGTRHRRLAVVTLVADDGRTGWGECSALTEPGYWFETADSSFPVLSETVAGLVGHDVAGLLDLGSSPGGLQVEGRPMARAALEMAALDLLLGGQGRSLAESMGAGRRSVPAGATVGLGPIAWVADRVAGLRAEGYGRVKLKIEPGHDVEVVAAVGERVGVQKPGADAGDGIEVQVDGNGSYPAEGRSVETMVRLADLGVAAIEQPFPIDAPAAAADLVAALDARGLASLVMADEAASTSEAALTLVTEGAATGVVIKPSRLGGLGPARDLAVRLADAGAAVSAGGMLESGLGRHALAALAGLDAISITGDLSPARRWLADDPWPDLATTMSGDRLHIVVPSGPGVAPPPDLDTLDRYTVERWST